VQLTGVDWAVVAVYGAVTLTLGFWFSRRAGQNIEEYFIAGRSLPWWVAGTSIAATWFATDAPLATASLVRQQGIFANWLWWYEAAGIMLLVFFYAHLWRRAAVLTDAEFIELRYSGRPASFLRGFSAIYQGLLKNCVVMGWVMLAMVKFSQVMLGWDPAFTLILCVGLALVYTVAAGLWGVVVTDLLQFIAGMTGSMVLAGIVVVRLGGPTRMAEQVRALPDATPGVLDVVPQPAHLSPLEFASFLCLILVLWTRSGQGDGYLAQRLFAARDERQSVLSALWFSLAGTVLMTWPWIVVGLGSLVLLPVATATPELAADPELAYPMMIAELMPQGLRGLMVASFLAAFMSTMDTHLCWGASYLVNDVYRRFYRTDANASHYVLVSRVAVLFLVALAAVTAWQMESIERAWIYVIELTAGVALVWLLRWYWWRVNAWAEIAAMAGSVFLANGTVWAAIAFRLGLISNDFASFIGGFYRPELDFLRALAILLCCSILWVGVALFTAADDDEQLARFYRRVRPGGWWGPVAARCTDVRADRMPAARRWAGWAMGMIFLYGTLVGVGHLLTGRGASGTVAVLLGLASGFLTLRLATEVAEHGHVTASLE
jgi:SSS family solute:Na+ symporter